MRIEIRREDITSPVARSLITALNAELSGRYPEDGATHFRLDPDEVVPGRGVFLVAWDGQEPVGCGAVRREGPDAAEIKRMYVAPQARGRGVGRAVLAALEEEARRLGARRLLLETGDRLAAAMGLYGSAGFTRIPPFGEYVASPLSVCMAKDLSAAAAGSVVLRPISAAAGEALRAGRTPEGVRVAPDYPTEFSAGVGQHAGAGGALGPFFLHRAGDDVVVGEIGGGFVGPGTVEIGYAVVASCWGRGHATDAVRQLVRLARDVPDVARIVAHTPLDRPASGRVLEKAGFTPTGEVDDEHEGAKIRVRRWELAR